MEADRPLFSYGAESYLYLGDASSVEVEIEKKM